MAAVTSYSRTASNNNSAPPDGAPEGQTAGSVNNTIREIMKGVVDEATNNACKVLASVAGTNTITGTLSPDLAAYSAGMIVVLTPANTNTGATTLNIDSLGALDVFNIDGTACVGGELVAGIPAVLVLDSGADDWIIVNPNVLKSRGLEVGYRGLPFRVVSGDSNSVAADAGGDIVYTGGGGHTFTLDTDLGGSSSVLAICQIRNASASTLALTTAATLQWYSGAGLSTGARTLASGAVVTVLSDGTNFIVYGMGIS